MEYIFNLINVNNDIVTNNKQEYPGLHCIYNYSFLLSFLVKLVSNCEWDFYDPIHAIEKHAQAHNIFSTDFFVLELSVQW